MIFGPEIAGKDVLIPLLDRIESSLKLKKGVKSVLSPLKHMEISSYVVDIK